MNRALVAMAVAASSWAQPASAQEAYGLPLQGEAAETFLRTAEYVSKKGIKIGITNPDQYTLTDGTRTLRAAWKTIDEFKRGITSLQGGGVIVDFADSYKHEIAAYELDKLIGLHLVPPTVERTFGGRKGSLQLWVEGAMTEAERKKKKITPARPRDLERADVQGAPAAPADRQHRLPQHQQRALRPVVPGLRGGLLARLHHLRRPARPEGARSLSRARCSRP